MKTLKILITGSSGLIGSEAVRYFGAQGHKIIGIDNNLRKYFFGKDGDTSWNLKTLLNSSIDFTHLDVDIRDRTKIQDIYKTHRPDVTIHCASQPSHDLAAKIPFDDFDTNAVGTLNLLEASRRFTLESPFIYMSTNKVYGDTPNELELIETPTRYDYKDPAYYDGIDETMRIDRTKHSLFGASKAAADLVTQEYGRYFNMPTVCFRGGCLTGPAHSAVELHGFLSYFVKAALTGKKYTIFGYKGKQVRDQIHSKDVVRAFECFINKPRSGEVYNLGGGRNNSISILECINLLKDSFGLTLDYTYSDNNRIGDHICYISNLKKLKSHYPEWAISIDVISIIKEIINTKRDIQKES
ncbi:MAG: NAD-dependent epimerase/dehydratase family protein [Deltaproteobacteria bacterium]|nr:NAD-dependent epimerase/dehydratase family protein [Deltaproteobacteria bacterium]MCL5276185.1 NAD-dependent epimerase/dehydratase family protein [Deltaproteobacteria bacterium]